MKTGQKRQDSLADLNLSANNLLIFLFLQHGKFGFT